MKLYLTGTIAYLNKERAEHFAKGHDEIREEDDGTFTVIHLSPKPCQPGQSPWGGS